MGGSITSSDSSVSSFEFTSWPTGIDQDAEMRTVIWAFLDAPVSRPIE